MMSEWKNIATAPKDGTSFIAWEKGYAVSISSWDKFHDGGAGGFRNSHHGHRPTHWMPLPQPPKGDDNE